MKFLDVGGSVGSMVPKHFEGWDRSILDIDPAVHPDICMDAREMLSLEPAQFDAVLCAHNLEHYYAHDVPKVLAGMKHVTKLDGLIDVRVPDLGWAMRQMRDRHLELTDTIGISSAGPLTALDMIYGYQIEIERSGQDFFAHKTGFTHATLKRALEAAGLVKVQTGAAAGELRAVGFLSEPSRERLKQLAI